MAFSGVLLNIVVLLVLLRVKIVDAKEKPLRNNEPIESEPVLPESEQLDQPDEDKHFKAFVSAFLTKRKEQKQMVQNIKGWYVPSLMRYALVLSILNSELALSL